MSTSDADPAVQPQEPMDVGTALALLEIDLRLGLALQKSQTLRIRLLEDRPALLVSLPQHAGWMHLTSDGVSISRDRPVTADGVAEGMTHQLIFVVTRSDDQAIRLAFEASTDLSRQLIMSVFEDDRQAFNQLTQWAPLIEASAFRVGAMFTANLDRMRREVLEACAVDQPDADYLAVNYRRLVDALARWTLLGTDGASPWLAQMAAKAAWERWTPSFALVRERDRWGALIGARAASRFGPTVIDPYLEILGRARHPLHALDALVGLAAIGLQHPGERAPLVKSLDDELVRLPNRETFRPDIFAIAFAEARRTLTETTPDRGGIASRREDPFNLDAAGRMPVFTLLATALQSPTWRFIAPAREARPIAARMARETLIRAWGAGKVDLASLPTWVFGRA